MTKLSDTQRVILSAAAQHEMGLARASKTLPAATRNAVFRSLIKNNLLTEINAPRDFIGLGWRQDDDGTWIVARILAQDGRHVTVGRAAPPSDAEIAAAAAALVAQGLAGWLATLDGNYWTRRRVALAPVQILGVNATLDWHAAISAFEAARQPARAIAATRCCRRNSPAVSWC